MVLRWALIGSFRNRQNFFNILSPDHIAAPYRTDVGCAFDSIRYQAPGGQELIIQLFSLTDNSANVSRFITTPAKPSIVFYYPENYDAPHIKDIKSFFPNIYVHYIGSERNTQDFQESFKKLLDDLITKPPTDESARSALAITQKLITESIHIRTQILADQKDSLIENFSSDPWVLFSKQKKIHSKEAITRLQITDDELAKRSAIFTAQASDRFDMEHPTPKRITAYTVDIETCRLDPSTQRYYGHPSIQTDIQYRLQVFQSIVQTIAKTLQNTAPGDLIVACLPEFFFRGGSNGCYFVATSEDTSDSSHYYQRKHFVQTQILDQCKQIVSETFRAIIDQFKLSGVIFCCGTAPVAKPCISQYRQQPNDIPTVKVDNFALIVGQTVSGYTFGHLVDKRHPSKVDYYEILGLSGSYHTSVVGPGRTIPIFQNDGSTVIAYPLSRSLHSVIPKDATKSTMTLKRAKPVSTQKARIAEPAWFSIPTLFSPYSHGKNFCIGVAICLDAHFPIFENSDSPDLIFAPSAGMNTTQNQQYTGITKTGTIIRADGDKPGHFSSVGYIVHETVRYINKSFPGASPESIQIPALKIDPKYFYTAETGYFTITKRGCLTVKS